MLKALAIFLMLAATLACLTMLTFLMAGGANASPKQITQLKWMMLATGLAWLIGVGGGIVALCTSRDALGAWLAASPIAVVIVAFIILWVSEW